MTRIKRWPLNDSQHWLYRDGIIGIFLTECSSIHSSIFGVCILVAFFFFVVIFRRQFVLSTFCNHFSHPKQGIPSHMHAWKSKRIRQYAGKPENAHKSQFKYVFRQNAFELQSINGRNTPEKPTINTLKCQTNVYYCRHKSTPFHSILRLIIWKRQHERCSFLIK